MASREREPISKRVSGFLAGIAHSASGIADKARGGATPIERKIHKLTNSEFVDVPRDIVDDIARSSFSPDDRKIIMDHLAKCFADTDNWRKVYAAMVIVEALVNRGSPEIVRELSEGRHIDVVQKLNFLAVFFSTFKWI